MIWGAGDTMLDYRRLSPLSRSLVYYLAVGEFAHLDVAEVMRGASACLNVTPEGRSPGRRLKEIVVQSLLP